MVSLDHIRETVLPLARFRFHFSLARLDVASRRVPLLPTLAVVGLLGDALGRSGYVWTAASPVQLALCTLPLVWIVAGSGGRRGRVVLALAGLLWANHAAHEVRFPRFSERHIAALVGRGQLRVEAEVERDVAPAATRVRLPLRVSRWRGAGGWEAAEGRIQVTLGSVSRPWLAGQKVHVSLRPRRPRPLGNPGESDHVGYLASRGIYATAYLASDAALTPVEEAASPPTWLRRWRRAIADRITTTLDEPRASVLAALIIGAETPLPRPLREAFARAGVSHVLSISGLHVGLVATAAFLAIRWLLSRSLWLLLHLNLPKVATLLSVFPVLLYAGIAGDNVATRRSLVMILVFLGAMLVDRQRHLLVSLAAAACSILVVSPGVSLDLSFQLSFVAVLGISLGIERFWPWWRRREEARLARLRSPWRNRLTRSLALYATVSVSALVATAPLTAYHFNQVSLVAPIANALVVPLLGSIAVVLGLLAAVAVPVSTTVATWTIALAGPFVGWGIALTELAAALPGAACRIVTPSVMELGLIYSVLWVSVRLEGAWRRRLLLGLLGLAVVDVTYWLGDRYGREDLRVTFLSVGQGDATVVEFPDGAVMVIDGGGSFGDDFSMGERVVAPFLWGRKIGRVDCLVLTHPDRDHYGGLVFLAEQFAPREVWTTGAGAAAEEFLRLARAIDASPARRFVLRRGDRRWLGEAAVDVLSPARLNEWGDNDESLVLRFGFGGRSFLFPGDIQALAEEELVRNGSLSTVTVLKVPHHGSRTSSSLAFLRQVNPRIAVVSAGYGNRFRFPNASIVERYRELGAKLLRTDLDGGIEIRVSPRGRLGVRTGLVWEAEGESARLEEEPTSLAETPEAQRAVISSSMRAAFPERARR